MTYVQAIKKAAAWWDPTSWGQQEKKVDHSQEEWTIPTKPLDDYSKEVTQRNTPQPQITQHAQNAKTPDMQPSTQETLPEDRSLDLDVNPQQFIELGNQTRQPTYSSSYQRAQQINADNEQAKALGAQEDAAQLQRRVAMKQLGNQVINSAGGMDDADAAARAASAQNMAAYRQQAQRQIQREKWGNLSFANQQSTPVANTAPQSFASPSALNGTAIAAAGQQRPQMTYANAYSQIPQQITQTPVQQTAPAPTYTTTDTLSPWHAQESQKQQQRLIDQAWAQHRKPKQPKKPMFNTGYGSAYASGGRTPSYSLNNPRRRRA